MGRPGARRLLAFCHFTDDNTGVDVSAGLEKPAGWLFKRSCGVKDSSGLDGSLEFVGE